MKVVFRTKGVGRIHNATGNYPRFKVSCIRCRKVYSHNKLPGHTCRTPEEAKLDKYWRIRRNGLVEGRLDIDGNPIEWRLSKQEVKLLLHEAGITIWDVGNAGNKYCLARYNDRGHYEYGNCRFITNRENIRESNPGRHLAEHARSGALWEKRREKYGQTGTKDKENGGGWKTRRMK